MKKNMGFTLIESLIVVAIIAIIASYGYSSYVDSVHRTNRAEAKIWLSDVDQRFQRCLSSYGKYDDANCGVYNQLKSGGSIITKDKGFYKITINNVTSISYDLKADAVSGLTQSNDTGGCISMTLDSKGNKGPAGCW